MNKFKNKINKIFRKIINKTILPFINHFSESYYIQFRPDHFRKKFHYFNELQKIWKNGQKNNNSGDYSRLYFFVASIEGIERRKVPGAFAELGVFRGNSARIMREIAPERELYLFDTFEGFPEEQARQDPSNVAGGGFSCSLEQVRRFVGTDPKIVYCPGTFPETSSMVRPGVEFALVHLDCDLYQPTKAALEFFYPRMVPGGLLILHDYQSGHWPGIPRAVDEFMSDKPEGLVHIPDKSGTVAFAKHEPIR